MRDTIEIERINTYKDNRFSQNVLYQHGCFLIDNEPYEIKIISEYEAIIRGNNQDNFLSLIEEFRFYTPHITCFYNDERRIVREYPRACVFDICLDEIQPSQFYVDEDKIKAISSFINSQEDIIIQVLPYEGRYISLDGHTRLMYAVMNGWKQVRAVVESSDEWVYKFVDEARKRNISTPYDLTLLKHEEYEIKWNHFCDDFFNT